MSKHAYLIIAHNHINQLKRLVKSLDWCDNDIFVHVDKKWKDFNEAELVDCVKTSNLYFVKRLNVIWGHYSQIECELILVATAVRNNDYQYIHLLSGGDFCLKSQKEIHDFFDKNYPAEFIYFDKAGDNHIAIGRCKEYHFLQRYTGKYKNKKNAIKNFEGKLITFQKMIGVNRCKNIENYLSKGSNWFSITGSFAKELVAQKAFIKKHFRFTVCCDEVFVHTIFRKSQLYANKYKPEDNVTYNNKFYTNMVYTDWERGRPYIFKKDDFEELVDSPYLFARKFDESVDSEILELLEQYISRKG